MADLHLDDPRDTLKMIRETLCTAQAFATESLGHRARLQRMIDEIDRQRPLGPDGKHGDRHTPTCGCEPGLGKVLILARNMFQAGWIAKDAGLTAGQWEFVHRVDQLHGQQQPRVLMVPEWALAFTSAAAAFEVTEALRVCDAQITNLDEQAMIEMIKRAR